MTPQQIRILRLARNSMIGAAVVMLLSLWIVHFSYQRFLADEQRQADGQRKERAAKRKLGALNDDMVQAGLARDDFERLRNEGTLGELSKTQLLDGIERALHPFGGAVVEYKLAGQREFGHPALARLERHKTIQHQLELTLKPLHELEFLDIWMALAEGRRGLAPIESCELLRKQGATISAGSSAASTGSESGDRSRTDQGSEGAGSQAVRLEAKCVLIAYTFRFEAPSGALAATAPMPVPRR